MMLLYFVVLYLCVLHTNASVLKRSVQQQSEASLLINGSTTISAIKSKSDSQKSSCELEITKNGHVIDDGGVAFAVAGVENQVYCDATCTGSGMPPALQWFKKGSRIRISKYSSKRVYAVRTTHNRISILTISNMLGIDTGKYTCRGWLIDQGWVKKSIDLQYSCGSSSFMCDGTRCMNNDLECDGVRDCRDGTDESDCATTPTTTTTTNTTSVAQTIPTRSPIDYDDYYDNEMASTATHRQTPSTDAQTTDITSQTPPPTTSINEHITDTTSQKTLPTTDFTTALPSLPCDNGFECEPGLCIVLDWKCDGTRDCPDGSDEASCPELTSMTTNVPTTSTDVQTTDMTSQVTPSTTEATTGCSVDEFSCAPERCVSISALCDDVPDCSNGMDEKNCIPAISCNEGMVACADGGLCISPSQKCDGEPHCLNGSDEKDCNTITEELMEKDAIVATLDDTEVEFSETLEVMKISHRH